MHNDWDGISEVTSLPDAAPHRNVDKLVLAAGPSSGGKVRTATVCPPTIYGQGRGPGNRRSHQVPELARCTISAGHGIMVGEGKTLWTCVHVADLSDLYLALFEAALRGGPPATWGPEGYYFAENGDIVWGEVAAWVAAEAKRQGLVEEDGVRSCSAAEAGRLTPMGGAIWGANSRARAVRARELLGWRPARPGLREEIRETVEVEARRLGRVKGHAEVAAGDA